MRSKDSHFPRLEGVRQLERHVRRDVLDRGITIALAGSDAIRFDPIERWPVPRRGGQRTIVRGAVQGTEPYEVVVETIEDAVPQPKGELRCSCSCPYFTDRRQICKHVVAFLLFSAAERHWTPPFAIRSISVGTTARAEPRRPTPGPHYPQPARSRREHGFVEGDEWLGTIARADPRSAVPLVYGLRASERDRSPIISVFRRALTSDGRRALARADLAEARSLPLDPLDRSIIAALAASAVVARLRHEALDRFVEQVIAAAARAGRLHRMDSPLRVGPALRWRGDRLWHPEVHARLTTSRPSRVEPSNHPDEPPPGGPRARGPDDSSRGGRGDDRRRGHRSGRRGHSAHSSRPPQHGERADRPDGASGETPPPIDAAAPREMPRATPHTESHATFDALPDGAPPPRGFRATIVAVLRSHVAPDGSTIDPPEVVEAWDPPLLLASGLVVLRDTVLRAMPEQPVDFRHHRGRGRRGSGRRRHRKSWSAQPVAHTPQVPPPETSEWDSVSTTDALFGPPLPPLSAPDDPAESGPNGALTHPAIPGRQDGVGSPASMMPDPARPWTTPPGFAHAKLGATSSPQASIDPLAPLDPDAPAVPERSPWDGRSGFGALFDRALRNGATRIGADLWDLLVDELRNGPWAEVTLPTNPRVPPVTWVADPAFGMRYFDDEPDGVLRLDGAPGRQTADLLPLARYHHPEEAAVTVDRDPRTHRLLDEEAGLTPHVPRIRRASESRLAMRAEQILRVARGSGTERWRLPRTQIPKLLKTAAAARFAVELARGPTRHGHDWSLTVSSGVNWFDLTGGLETEAGVIPLHELVSAMRRNPEAMELLPLADGSSVTLPPELREVLRRLARVWSERESQSLRFARADALFLDALLASSERRTTDAAFRDLCDRLGSREHPERLPAPSSFAGELRPYQEESLGWFAGLRELSVGGCLADEMGLGKTVQVLAMLDARRAARENAGSRRRAPVVRAGHERSTHPSLVIVPRSLVRNWLSESARFTPDLRVLDLSGPKRSLDDATWETCDVAFMTYGTLVRDVDRLSKHHFDYLILDEAQAIKNSSSQAAKAVKALKADHRLAMTGTPIENHLGELWSVLDFLNPGSDQHLAKLARGGDPEDLTLVRNAVRPFLLRRTKREVAPELPERIEQTIVCDLTEDQRAHYETLLDRIRADLASRVERVGFDKARFDILAGLLRLRQVACHPVLVDARRADAGSGKLEALMPMLEESAEEGRKTLVFSQFTSFLALVRAELDERGLQYAYLDGQTRNRAEVVEHFRDDPECAIFLLSLKAGGVGLNLQAAERVILLDPWWNPAVEAQAIDRAHRIGQDRTVHAIRLVSAGTIEERVLDLQQRKRDLTNAILGDQPPANEKSDRDDADPATAGTSTEEAPDDESGEPLVALTRSDLEFLLGGRTSKGRPKTKSLAAEASGASSSDDSDPPSLRASPAPSLPEARMVDAPRRTRGFVDDSTMLGDSFVVPIPGKAKRKSLPSANPVEVAASTGSAAERSTASPISAPIPALIPAPTSALPSSGPSLRNRGRDTPLAQPPDRPAVELIEAAVSSSVNASKRRPSVRAATSPRAPLGETSEQSAKSASSVLKPSVREDAVSRSATKSQAKSQVKTATKSQAKSQDKPATARSANNGRTSGTTARGSGTAKAATGTTRRPGTKSDPAPTRATASTTKAPSALKAPSKSAKAAATKKPVAAAAKRAAPVAKPKVKTKPKAAKAPSKRPQR